MLLLLAGWKLSRRLAKARAEMNTENKLNSIGLVLVSIIITTRNRAIYLRQTLEAISQLLVPQNFDVELIVVDNGSTDETSAIIASTVLQNISVVYLYEGKPGQTSARNSGMAIAKGDIFLWTDDDTRPPQNWIAQMCLPILQDEAMGVSGKIRTAPHLERDWMTRTHYDRLSDTRFMPEDFGSMIGANMAFHREVLRRVPNFDTVLGPGNLGFMDDTLFSYQMQDKGYKIVALPHVSVEHNFDPSRLQRQAWLSHGVSSGRSLAYVYYHWEHKSVRVPTLDLLFWQCALAIFRLTQPLHAPESEGCHRHEIRMVQNISFIKQYLIERKHPRRYERMTIS